MANAFRNNQKIDCFQVTFGMDDFEYGSSIEELSKYLENSWYEEVHE